MFHVVLFGCVAAVLALFAFNAARADQYLIAIPAAILAAWFAESCVSAIRRRRGVVSRSAKRDSEKSGRPSSATDAEGRTRG